MTNTQWTAFSSFRDRFRAQCAVWSARTNEAGEVADWLKRLQQAAADADGNVAYPIQTPIVYNTSLDGLTESDEIKLIVVGDNPGKDEQLEKNKKYLVGQAGKLGDGFFRKNPDLGIQFRTNVVILNKTPIHTAKTKQLSHMLKNGGPAFAGLFDETQRWMARETALLQQTLGCGLWLVGYGELRQKGLFAAYAEELKKMYRGEYGAVSREADEVRLYQHFSMNRFSIDLADRYDRTRGLHDNLKTIGISHRAEILGW